MAKNVRNYPKEKIQIEKFRDLIGHGGGASGRAVAFCPNKLGSNPRMDLAFLVQNCCESILAERWAFSKVPGIEQSILFLLISCFLSQLSNVLGKPAKATFNSFSNPNTLLPNNLGMTVSMNNDQE